MADGVLQVLVLGPVRARRGDRELDLGPTRQRAVFAVLAASAGRWIGRDNLIKSVWGATPPATAAGSVYTYVSNLRRALGEDAGRLNSGPSGYVLDLPTGTLDRDRFRALRGEEADPVTTAIHLDTALALWHGEAYAGLDIPGLADQRATLGREQLDTIERRMRLGLVLGDDGLVAQLTAYLRRHPLHEPLYAVLLEALALAGRRSEAHSVFAAARRILGDELGVEPSPELRAVYEQATASEPAAGRSSAAGPLVAGSIADAPAANHGALVGRDAELATLRALADARAGGSGAVVWVEGEPGVGRTSLLNAAFAGAAVRRTLDDTRPGLIIVDDLHSADDATAQAWQRLAAATAHTPLLLVGAAIEDPADTRLDALRRTAGHVLRLAPLPIEYMAELAPVAAVAARADGNPRYAHELATGLQRRGDLPRIAVAPGALADPPPELRNWVAGTLARLDALARAALYTGALLGTEFSIGEVAAVLDRPTWDVVGALEQAVAAGVLRATGDAPAFRSPCRRQIVGDLVPMGQRVELRRRIVEVLGAAGQVQRAAEQLAADPPSAGPWMTRWLAAHHAQLAPDLAGPLIRHALTAATGTERAGLLAALVRLEVGYDRDPGAAGAEALSVATDPATRAELRQLLAVARLRHGDTAGAVALLEEAIAYPDTPPEWRKRQRRLLRHVKVG